MLRILHIENIAVIRCIDVEFGSGFTVLSGETGAGKSILIDSVNLLMGGKFNREVIRSGETQATVSGMFENLSSEVLSIVSELGYETSDETILLFYMDCNKTLSPLLSVF